MTPTQWTEQAPSNVIRKICLRIMCFLGLICFASIHAHAVSVYHTRIAVISDEASNLQGSPLISLLEVELSQTEGIELLERGEIEAILKEQELILSGMLDRKNILKIGRLLRTDAFLLLNGAGFLLI